MPSTSMAIRPLKRSTMPLVWDVRGRMWRCCAVLRADGDAGFGEIGGEATAVVGQHVGELEGEGGCGLAQEGDGTLFGFVILDS